MLASILFDAELLLMYKVKNLLPFVLNLLIQSSKRLSTMTFTLGKREF